MKPLPQILSLILLILTISCASQPAQETNQPVQEIVNRFISKPELSSASVGILIADAETGEMIAAHNPDKSLIPASIQKLLIAGAALEKFGAGHTFTTSLFYTGQIDDEGTLHGDVMIRGGGDPALGSERFTGHYGDVIEKMASAIREAGIRQIKGNIIGDGSYFGRPQIPDTWIWEDIGNYYGSPSFGLNIFENTYRLTFSSGAPGSLTKIKGTEPELPGIEFENFVKAAPDNRDNAYIFGSYMSPVREFRGTIPAHRDAFSIKGSIPNPPLQSATLLTEKLIEKGIHVTDKPGVIWSEANSRKSTTIKEFQSPPLSALVEQLNMKSINLYAESFLLHLARANGRNVSVEEGCKVLYAFWALKDIDTTGLFLEDASGLSRANGITPDQLASVLNYMKNKSPESESFMNSLPKSGISGSLRSFAPELPGKFRAKSGYMSRVLNYAGYLETASGKNLIVVLMVNNHTCSGAEMRKLWEGLVVEVYEQMPGNGN